MKKYGQSRAVMKSGISEIMRRSKAIRAADAEKRKIAKWLEKLTEHGFKVLIVTARFSNGETHYAERTPRTQLLAAARA